MTDDRNKKYETARAVGRAEFVEVFRSLLEAGFGGPRPGLHVLHLGRAHSHDEDEHTHDPNGDRGPGSEAE